jgi:phage gp45-like
MTPRATAHRAVLNFGRVMFKGCYDDQYMMQQFEGSGMKDAGMAHVERAQDYGFRSVPMPPGQGEGSAGWGPMGYAVAHGGNPSHQIVSGVEDPRYTPYKMPQGSSFQYNHGGEGTYVDKEAGSFMLAGGYNEKADQARASIRHVTKQQQSRQLKPLPMHGASGGGGGGVEGGANAGRGGGGQQQQQQYKHQGESPSSEIWAEKDRVFAKAAKSHLFEHTAGLHTLVDDKHVAIFASKEVVAWVDKQSGLPLVTKPWQVRDYPYQKPTPSSTG